MLEELKKAPPIGEARDRELLKDASSFVYYASPDGELPAHFYFPPGHGKDRAPAPAIVFFHGGLWDASMPTQFIPHCHHFSARGAVTLTVEYRVRNKYPATPVTGLEDAIMAVVFLKKNAEVLNIDPERIILAGAGSGAHLALALATIPQIGKMSSEEFRPAAVFAYSAIVNTTP
ncbi:MAG: alpha/beta hydrolase, partial [Akkermansiaceae bacterium]|nr:alpha/beta hydrolase [Akkermansiaceae bacterium]